MSDYTPEQKKRIHSFVLSVFHLFPDYGNELKNPDNMKFYCRQHADAINAMSSSDYQNRLAKVSKLVAAQNSKNLVGNYKNAIHALAAACGDYEKLSHDYHIVYPVGQGSTGALQAIKQLEAMPKDEEKQKANIERFSAEMSELFKNVRVPKGLNDE